MNNNASIARELVRIAKSIIADNRQYIFKGYAYDHGPEIKISLYASRFDVSKCKKQTLFSNINKYEKLLNDKAAEIVRAAAADGFNLKWDEDNNIFSIEKNSEFRISNILMPIDGEGTSATKEQRTKWLENYNVSIMTRDDAPDILL